MLRDDRISPKRVALKSTIPSFVSGMFMVTRRCRNIETNKLKKTLAKATDSVLPFGLTNQYSATTF